MFKWFKERFKTVYCDECQHRSENEWYGHYDCYASPVTINFSTNGTRFKSPKTNIAHGHKQCRNVKYFSWCKKYKSKG